MIAVGCERQQQGLIFKKKTKHPREEFGRIRLRADVFRPVSGGSEESGHAVGIACDEDQSVGRKFESAPCANFRYFSRIGQHFLTKRLDYSACPGA